MAATRGLLVMSAAALCMGQFSDTLYMYQSKEQEVKTGGVYKMEEQTCNGVGVWVCRECKGEKALYLSSDSHWVFAEAGSGNVTCDEAQLVRSLVAYDVAMSETGPNTTARWMRSSRNEWVYDDEVRVTSRGCEIASGCLQLNCHEPEDGHTCDDCTLYGGSLSCGDDFPLNVVFLSLVCVVVAAILAYSVMKCCKTETTPVKEPSRAPANESCGSYRTRIRSYRNAICVKMGLLGGNIANSHSRFIVVPLIVLLLIIAFGMPVAKVQKAGSYSADWVPRGGRLEEEINYVKKWSQDSKTGTNIQIMVGPKDTSQNVLTKHFLNELLRIYLDFMSLKVPAYFPNGTSVDVGYADWCLSIDNPLVDIFPCLNASPLDCFFEGSWMMGNVSQGAPLPVANQSVHYYAHNIYAIISGGKLLSYDARPSFQSMTDEEIQEHMSLYPTECRHWAPSVTKGRGYLFGGYEASSDMTVEEFPKEKLTSAKRIVGWAQQHSARRALSFRKTLQGLDETAVDDAMNRWFDVVSDRLEEIDKDEVNYPGTSVSVYMSVSLNRMFREIGKINAGQIIISLVLVVALVVATESGRVVPALIGLGLVLVSIVAGFSAVALFGITYNHTILQALPFFALGLGVDDMFLLLHYYKMVPMYVDSKRRPTADIMSDLLSKAGISVTLTSACIFSSTMMSALLVPIPALQDFLVATGVIAFINFTVMLLIFPAVLTIFVSRMKEDEAERSPCVAWERVKDLFVSVVEGYRSFIEKPAAQYAIALLNLVLLILAVVLLSTTFPLEFGFNVVDLTPEGSFLSKGFQEREDYVKSQSLSHNYVVKAVDFPNDHRKIKELHQWVKYNKWTNDSTDTRGFYLDWMEDFAQNKGWLRNETGNVSTSKPTPPTFPYDERAAQWVEPERWYEVMMAWRNPDISGLDMVTSVTTDPFGWRFGFESYELNNTILKTNSWYTLNMGKLKKPSDWVDHIKFIGDGMDAIMGEGNAFPEPSGTYLNMQEFVYLQEFFWLSFIVEDVAFFFCGLMLGVGVIGSFLVSLSAMAVALQLMTVMMMLGIKFQSIAAVTVLLAKGVSIEFSVHVVVSYVKFVGRPEQRVAATVHDTCVPVLQGACSSFLMVGLFLFSAFPYVKKYFFGVLSISILIGLIHALFFLPATLAVIDRLFSCHHYTATPGNLKDVEDADEATKGAPPPATDFASTSSVTEGVSNPLKPLKEV